MTIRDVLARAGRTRSRVGRNRLLLRTFRSYLAVLLLPIAVGVAVCIGYLRRAVYDSEAAVLSRTRACLGQLDSNIAEMERYAIQLSIHPRLTRLLYGNDAYSPPLVYSLASARAAIADKPLPSELLTGYYIYLNRLDIILSPNRLYLGLPRFYGYFLQYDDMDAAEWRDRYLLEQVDGVYVPSTPASVDGKPMHLILYARSLPLSTRESHGALLLAIDADRLAGLFQTLISEGGRLLDVTNREGQRLIDGGDDVVTGLHPPAATKTLYGDGSGSIVKMRMGGQVTLVVSARSHASGWLVRVAIAARTVYRGVRVLTAVVVTVLVVVFVFGAAFAFALAYRRTAPLIDILRNLQDADGGEDTAQSDEYGYLRSSLGRLLASNAGLRDQLRAQEPMAQQLFFERLIHGEVVAQEAIDDFCARQQIGTAGQRYLILLVCLHGYGLSPTANVREELNAVRALLRHHAQVEVPECVFAHEVGADSVAILLSYAADGEPAWVTRTERIALDLSEYCRSQFSLHVSISGSQAHERMAELSGCIEEARQALAQGNGNGGTEALQWYRRNGSGDTALNYPLELEATILASVRAGDTSRMQQALQSLLEKNFRDRSLSIPMAECLIAQAHGTVLRVLNELPPREQRELEALRQRMLQTGTPTDPEDAFGDIGACLRTLCEFMQAKKRSHNSRLRDGIVGYLEAHFADTGMSLCMVADQFGISEPYLSQFFKEQVGENFHVFLERTRIRCALRLLAQTRMPIRRVALESGYVSANTFTKAFRRTEGSSPMQYRRSCAGGGLA